MTTPGAEASSRFRAGFLFAQENTEGLVRIPSLMLRGLDHAEDLGVLGHWLKTNRIDAIFTTCDRVRQMLGEIGRRVPDDIALAVTSVLDGNADAGIDQRPVEIGKCAVELLVSQIHHAPPGWQESCRMVTVQSRWVDGESLPSCLARTH